MKKVTCPVCSQKKICSGGMLGHLTLKHNLSTKEAHIIMDKLNIKRKLSSPWKVQDKTTQENSIIDDNLTLPRNVQDQSTQETIKIADNLTSSRQVQKKRVVKNTLTLPRKVQDKSLNKDIYKPLNEDDRCSPLVFIPFITLVCVTGFMIISKMENPPKFISEVFNVLDKVIGKYNHNGTGQRNIDPVLNWRDKFKGM